MFLSSDIFLNPNRNTQPFVADASQIQGFVEEAFEKTLGRPFPFNIRVNLLGEEEFNRNKSEIRSDQYGDPIEIKHSEWLGENLVAISNGGLFNINNLVISCISCNSSKGSYDWEEWYIKQDFYSKVRYKRISKF